MIYKSYLVPNEVMTDEHFLRYLFSETLLEALGLKDDSGVIYELINYRFGVSPFAVTLLPGSLQTTTWGCGRR